MKLRKLEDLMKQDWYIKLDKEGREITPEMGKPSILSKKKFIEQVETKIKSRHEILASIQQDRVNMSGKEEKLEMIISDSDDPHQRGIWSDDQASDDDEGIQHKSLSEVKWVPKLEA